MLMRHWGLTLLLALGLFTAGCPGDDDDDSGDSDGGVSDAGADHDHDDKGGRDDDDGDAGEGGSSGKGGSSSGEAGSSGKGGTGGKDDGAGGSGGSDDGDDGDDGSSGKGGSDDMPPDCGAADPDTEDMGSCTGEKEFSECAQEHGEECSACYNGADSVCAEFKKCLEDADDQCNADCVPSDECSQCQQDVVSCLYNEKCPGILVCDGVPIGGTEPGGACDQLEDCCGTLDGLEAELCTTSLDSAKIAGDGTCMQLLTSLCGDDGSE
jgi:hypothetical protein